MHKADASGPGTGGFDLADAIGVGAIEALSPGDPLARLRPAHRLPAAVPRLDLPADATRALRCGQTVVLPGVAPGRYRAYDPSGIFVGVISHADGWTSAERMMGMASAPQDQALP